MSSHAPMDRTTSLATATKVCDATGKTKFSEENMGRLVHILVHTGEKAYLCQRCGLDLVDYVSMRGMPLSWALCGKFQCTTIITCDYLLMCNVIIIEHIRIHKVNSSIYCQYEYVTESLLKYAETMGSLVHMLIHTGEKAYSRQLLGASVGCKLLGASCWT